MSILLVCFRTYFKFSTSILVKKMYLVGLVFEMRVNWGVSFNLLSKCSTDNVALVGANVFRTSEA